MYIVLLIGSQELKGLYEIFGCSLELWNQWWQETSLIITSVTRLSSEEIVDKNIYRLYNYITSTAKTAIEHLSLDNDMCHQTLWFMCCLNIATLWQDLIMTLSIYLFFPAIFIASERVLFLFAAISLASRLKISSSYTLEDFVRKLNPNVTWLMYTTEWGGLSKSWWVRRNICCIACFLVWYCLQFLFHANSYDSEFNMIRITHSAWSEKKKQI